jgi:predicted RNA-binding protein with PUA-like domain
MAKVNYWLMKSDPDEYAIEDFKKEPDRRTYWDGVRNYQARNFMRDAMQLGDRVLFYHSGKKPSVMGTATVVRTGYPDHTAWDPKDKHFAPKSTPDNPIWYMVDIQLDEVFPRPVTLKELRTIKGLENMMLLKKGMRLSIQPVTAKEFNIICGLV